MSNAQMALEYLLVYCTSHGLTSIGEPPLPKTYRPVGDSLVQTQRNGTSNHKNGDSREAMPVWIIFTFLALATAKYILSFMVWYIFQVVSTVIIVASTRIRTIAAANAERHPDSQRARIDHLVRTLRAMRAFRAAGAHQLRRVSVGDVRQTLHRRSTLQKNSPKPGVAAIIGKGWARITKLACFRGFSSYLIMAVSQWYIPVVIDFFLSGQPNDFRLGYGSTSIVYAVLFGPGFAVWTHYTITRPSNKSIYAHFPKGNEIIYQLWDITAIWAIMEHLTMSCPLALSRWFKLRDFAFDADTWNTLDGPSQQTKITEFALVFLLYLVLVAAFAIPANMTMRRLHASMLSDEDLAIVPCHRGDRSKMHPYDHRSKIRSPGLSISQAWSTITWDAYLRVVFVYMQYFAMNQFIQMAYWSANWKLHQVLEVDRYTSTNLPCSPVGRVLPVSARIFSSDLNSTNTYHAEL